MTQFSLTVLAKTPLAVQAPSVPGIGLFFPVVGRPDETVHRAIVSEGQVLDIGFAAKAALWVELLAGPAAEKMAVPRASCHDEAGVPAVDLAL